jgi:two-component system, OmpR family, response regulator RegX3
LRTLLVDDEPSICEAFARVAKRLGYTDIDTVSSGEEALTQVLRQQYDFITLDIRMPGVSGLEIIAILRNMCPHAVIALISAYLPDALDSEVAACADVIIAKPVDLDIFVKLLEGVERISETLEELRALGSIAADRD